MERMSTLRAEVRGGQAVIKDLEEYPDGSVVELLVVSDGELSDAEHERLDASLDASRAQLESGQKIDAEEVIRQLRSK